MPANTRLAAHPAGVCAREGSVRSGRVPGQAFCHPQDVSAPFLVTVLNLIHDRPYEMRTKPSRPDLVQRARLDSLEVDGRPAIPQDDLNSFGVPRAGHIDCVAGFPEVCVPDYVGTG